MTESKAKSSTRHAATPPLADTSGDTGDTWLEGLSTMDPADQQLAVPDASDPIKALLDYARANMMEEETDTEAVYARMAAQLMAANSVDEVLDTQDSTKAETILNIPIWVTSVTVQESDEEFAEGVGYFVIIKGIRSDRRTEVAVSCGGWSVFMELVRIHMLNDLPQMLCIRQKKRKTKNGYYPLFIGRPQ